MGVGTLANNKFAIHQATVPVPKFTMYSVAGVSHGAPSSGKVKFAMRERASRVALWLNTSFNFDYATEMGQAPDQVSSVHVHLVSLRDKRPVSIVCGPGDGGDQMVEVRADRMELAGELVQDLSGYLKLDELASEADFPEEMKGFEEILQKVEE